MSNPNDRHSNALIAPPANSEEVTAAFRMLTQADKEEVASVPEPYFVAHLLPMLSAPAGSKVDLTMWLEVAGTPLRAIDVTDSATGEILYRVPPLMRTLPTVYQQEVQYAEIIQGTQQREHVHPGMAQKFLSDQLGKARTGATLLDVESAAQWNLIRKRYGLPLLTVVGPDGKLMEASTSTSVAASNGNLPVFSDDQDDF